MEKLEKIWAGINKQLDKLNQELQEIKTQLKKEKENIKTLYDRLQIQITLAILENKLEILKRTKDGIVAKETLPSYDIAATSQNIIATPKSINNALKSVLEKDYKELEVLCSKRILANEFYEDSDKVMAGLFKFMCMFMGAAGGFVLAFSNTIIFIVINASMPSYATFFQFLLAIIGSAIGLKSYQNTTKKRLAVFEKIDSELQENYGTSFANSDFYLSYEELIEQQINKLMITEITQREYQANLDAYTESQQSQNTLMQTLNVEPVIDLEEQKEETNEVAGPRLVITKPVKPISLNED